MGKDKKRNKFSVNPFLQKASSFLCKVFLGELLHGYGSATDFLFYVSIGRQAGGNMAA
jgi:hypothetical protein